MNIVSFKCEEGLSKYVDSMLFDSNTVIATMECENGDEKVLIELMVRGEVRVLYKGNTYTSPCDFPIELKEKIKANPSWWDDEDVYIDFSNWFEYMYDHTINGETYSDGIMFEDDLSKYSVEDVKNGMIKAAEYIMEE